MEKKLFSQLVALFAVATVAIPMTAPTSHASFKDGRLECPVLRPIAQGFLAHHIDARKLDLEHEGRTIEQFIKRLDGQKIYLLESDVNEIRAMLRGSFTKLGEDCSPIEKAEQVFVKRLSEAAVFAKKILGPEFKFAENTELVFDPQKRAYPKTKQEQEAQLTKFIQFQISNYLASDMKLPKAKEQLIHRYDLLAKRESELKRDDLYARFLDGFATGLDAHSSYLDPTVLEDFEIQMRLSLEGIGAALTWDDGYTTVESLIPGGSAERSGDLQPKDKIISVSQGDGPFEQVIDMPLRDVVKLIRGKKGTKVRLTVLRQGTKETSRHVIALVRDKIKLEDEAAQLRFTTRKIGTKDSKVAVIELPSFYGDMSRKTRSCYEDVKKLVEKAKTEKAEAIVFDLSNNGGGLLTEAVRIGGLFIKKGNIVATQDAHSAPDKLADDDESVSWDGPLVVLTSRLSASASEIVAGALQDYHRAVIVGADHTFGKGTVQAMMNLPSGLGAIKVTTGMFFVPGGQSTQYRGVPADVVIPSPFSTSDIGERILDYSLQPRAIPAFVSSEANVSSGEGHWDSVDTDLVGKLKSRSTARVEKNPEFKKISEELAEAEKKKGVIKLADSLKKQKEEKTKEDKKKGKLTRRGKRKTDEEYLKSPSVSEAVAVAADMIELGARHNVATTTEHKTEKTEKN